MITHVFFWDAFGPEGWWCSHPDLVGKGAALAPCAAEKCSYYCAGETCWKSAVHTEVSSWRHFATKLPKGGGTAGFWPWGAAVDCTLQELSIGEAESPCRSLVPEKLTVCRRQRPCRHKTYKGGCMRCGVGSCWPPGAVGHHAPQRLNPQEAVSAAGVWCWGKPPCTLQEPTWQVTRTRKQILFFCNVSPALHWCSFSAS